MEVGTKPTRKKCMFFGQTECETALAVWGELWEGGMGYW